MLLLTILNHSPSVRLVCFWECSSCLIQPRSTGNGFSQALLCPLPGLLLATGCCAVTHIHPACKALSSGPLPALPALLHFTEVCSKYANSAKAKRLRIRSFSVWFCSFEGICFIFRSHHAYKTSDALRSVVKIQSKESWSTEGMNFVCG